VSFVAVVDAVVAAWRVARLHHGVVALFVPGRLCLVGEHSDWAGAMRARDPTIAPGACLVAGTDQGIGAEAARAADFEIHTRPDDRGDAAPFRCPARSRALRAAARSGGYFSYAAGVAAEIVARYGCEGVRLVITRADLPVARGLSSSAAVCVLVARAFDRVHRLELSIDDEMALAYAGERAAGSRCGRMDQVCAYGRQVVHVAFDGDGMAIDVLPPPPRPLALLIVDLAREKDTRRILDDLHGAFVTAAADAPLRRALGRDNHATVAAARAALAAGDAAGLGAVMREGQARFDRDVAPACPSELAAPRLHALLAHPACAELAWGGKGVGSQGDGAAQLVCRGFGERAALAAALPYTALPLTIGAPV
jgi:galactokinase